MCVTNQQVTNKRSEAIRSREMTHQLGIGLVVHQAIRSKRPINVSRAFGMSVGCRFLRVKGMITATLLEIMLLSDGIYVPSDMFIERYLFFAIDN